MDIPRIQKLLRGRFSVLVSAWSPALGIGTDSLTDWVEGIVGEGIAVALKDQARWNPKRGDFVHWSALKTRTLLRKELRNESRYQRTLHKLRQNEPHANHRLNLDGLRDELLDVLEQLPLTHQQALVLFYVNGMPIKEIAELLGKTPGAVYGTLSRARQKAKNLWQSPERRARLQATVSADRSGGAHSPRSPGEERRQHLELREFVDRLLGLNEADPPPRPDF